MRYIILLALAALGIFCTVFFITSIMGDKRTERAMKRALKRERKRRNKIWKEADSIRDMLNLYMTMVAKHGPDSEEAKAFRFGTDSHLMKEMHSDSEAMTAFEQQADIIDQTYRTTRRARNDRKNG